MEHRLLLNLATTAVLLLSTIALIFHVVQLILYSEYATNAGIPGILSTGYKPYILWIAVFCISAISSILNSIASCLCYCSCSVHYTIQSTRISSAINTCLTIGSLIYVTVASDIEPYTAGRVVFTHPAKGFINYCYLLNLENDHFYPSLYSRCWVYNLTWLTNIFLAAGWTVLLFIAIYFVRPSKKAKMNDYVAKLEQHNEHLAHTQRGYPLNNNVSHNSARKMSTQSFVIAHSRAGSMQPLMDRPLLPIQHPQLPPSRQDYSDVDLEPDTLLPPMPEQPYHYRESYIFTIPPRRPSSIPLNMTSEAPTSSHSYPPKYQTA